MGLFAARAPQAPDIFLPPREPARQIYQAFQAEASKRKERDLDVWIKAEIDAVHAAAVKAAQAMGLRAPTREEVVAAENYARGSADYGAKWAYGVVERMKRAQPA